MAPIRSTELVEQLQQSANDQSATVDKNSASPSRADLSRRSFVKAMVGGALIAAGSSLRLDAPPAVAQSRVTLRQLKGTKDGLILESLDGGRTWQRTANFGAHCAVVTLRDSKGAVFAELAVAGHRFGLKSADARKWYTV